MPLLTIRQVVTRIVIIISFAEWVIMLLLAYLPPMGVYSEAIFDTSMLALFTTYPIYTWIISPFVKARDDALTKIRHLAFTDSLTQLANRRLLLERLEEFLSSSSSHKIHGALLLLDIDGFKPINDAHGHDAGDAVLVEVAKRIRSVTRTEDMVCRLGGDEFVVLINRLDIDKEISSEKAELVAGKMLEQIKKPIYFRDQTFQISASIGIRLLISEKLDVATALREADIAMYRAKNLGGNAVSFFQKTS